MYSFLMVLPDLIRQRSFTTAIASKRCMMGIMTVTDHRSSIISEVRIVDVRVVQYSYGVCLKTMYDRHLVTAGHLQEIISNSYNFKAIH